MKGAVRHVLLISLDKAKSCENRGEGAGWKKKLIRIPEIDIIQMFSCVLLLSFINFNWFT